MVRRTAMALMLAGAALVASCGDSPPAPVQCMGMGTGAIVQAAALLRVDVYSAGTACDGIGVAAGSGAPILSMSFAQGQPITLDLPPGRHTVVLTAYSDAAATMLIGGACSDSDFQPGQEVCLDLTLAPGPDGGPDLSVCQGASCSCMTDADCTDPSLPRCAPETHQCVPCLGGPGDNCPSETYCTADHQCAPGCKSNADCAGSPDGGAGDGGIGMGAICDPTRHQCVQCLLQSDCPSGELCVSGFCVAGCDLAQGKTCPSGLTCCDKLCVDTQKDLANCGACGRACSTAGVATAQCAGGLCTSSCVSGAGNCVEPAAPAPDDGCETNTNTDVDNCGACGRACSASNVTTRACTAGACTSSCTTGFGNCSTPTAPAADDGCETNTTDDASHCGSCANACTMPPNASPSCSSSMCGMGACLSGYADCDASSGNGCECPTDPAAPGCCSGACQTQHSNGLLDSSMLPEHFYDCVALDTYTAAEAQKACVAATGDPKKCTQFTCTGSKTDAVICDNNGNSPCNCWDYALPGQTAKAAGSVDTSCLCPFAGETPMWH